MQSQPEHTNLSERAADAIRPHLYSLLDHPIEHRAIGVVYKPEIEKRSNYVPRILSARYAFVFLGQTKALLHVSPDGHQMPETYPFGV